MIVLGMLALGAGLLRAAAKPIERLVAAIELQRPGMTWRRVGWRKVPIDGVWTGLELREVVTALKDGKSTPLIEQGLARAEALKVGGCPYCESCGACFPAGAPMCTYCGGQIVQRKGIRT